MDEQFQQVNKSNKTILVVVVFIIITAVIVGSGVFLWQQSRVNQVARNYVKQNNEPHFCDINV